MRILLLKEEKALVYDPSGAFLMATTLIRGLPGKKLRAI